jgi:hypothetical protein
MALSATWRHCAMRMTVLKCCRGVRFRVAARERPLELQIAR